MRYAIIGITAGIANKHLEAIAAVGGDLVGVNARDPARGAARAALLTCDFYADHRVMLAQAKPDIVVILTPHPTHAALAIDCLAAGAHVLVEKPIAVRVAEADAMIAAADHSQRLLAVSFQQRTGSAVRTARRVIASGQLGRLQHVELVAAWPRAASYYSAKPWRGTWAGEGGGVLMNQGAHNLDALCFLFGSPEKVFGWTAASLHAIQAEDTAHAICAWPNGIMGSIHISTAEAGSLQDLQIRGTAGSLSLVDGEVRLRRLPQDFAQVVTQSPDPMPKPVAEMVPLSPETGSGTHGETYANLEAAIRDGVPLICDGRDAARSLELANAIILSAHSAQQVHLPLDRHQYETLFSTLTKSNPG